MEKGRQKPYFVNLQLGLQSQTPEDDHLPSPTSRIPDFSLMTGNQSPERGWCEDSQRNKPQSNSLAAAMLVFTSGGMSLAWSLGFSQSYSDLSQLTLSHMQICWFLAVIIGACLGTIFIDKLEKRILNLWASGLVFINGILFVSTPQSTIAIVFARYCDGIAVGITIIAAIVAGSEQAVKRFRGLVLMTESIGIVFGIMLRAFFTSMWTTNWGISCNRVQGILALVLGALALVCTSFLTKESPIFFLRQANEPAAIDVLKKLQTPYEGERNETYSLLYENKTLLQEDINRGHIKNLSRSYVPIMKLCLYRVLVSLSFSLPLNWGLLQASTEIVDGDSSWGLTIYGAMRMTGVIVAIFTVDTIGRREPTAIAMFIGGGLLFGIGAVFAGDETNLQTAIALLSIYQLFSGAAAPASTIYLGEAFSISVKPFFILVAVILENVIQITVCCSFGYSVKSVADYCFTLGALQFLFAICFVVIMPETKKTTLREALKRFQTNINIVHR